MVNITESERVVIEEPEKKNEPGVLDAHADEVLLSLGLPALLLPAVRAIKETGNLTKLCKHLPAEAAEALMWLAEGFPVEEVREAVSASAKGTGSHWRNLVRVSLSQVSPLGVNPRLP